MLPRVSPVTKVAENGNAKMSVSMLPLSINEQRGYNDRFLDFDLNPGTHVNDVSFLTDGDVNRGVELKCRGGTPP